MLQYILRRCNSVTSRASNSSNGGIIDTAAALLIASSVVAAGLFLVLQPANTASSHASSASPCHKETKKHNLQDTFHTCGLTSAADGSTRCCRVWKVARSQVLLPNTPTLTPLLLHRIMLRSRPAVTM